MIKSICTLTQEVQSGDILDVVRLDNAFRDPKSKEADRDYVFHSTYATADLRQLVEGVCNKLSGKLAKGIFVAAGGYGSGKSHALLVLYHLASAGPGTSHWLDEWGIKGSLPYGTKVVAVQLIRESASSLWELVFARAGKSDLNAKVKQWPTTQQWGEVAEDGPTLVIIDELEGWLDGLSQGDKSINKNALYNLADAATEQKYPLAVVVAVYGRKPELFEPLLRVEPPYFDFSTTHDRERIVIHRLVAEVDEAGAEQVINKYVESYAAAADLLPSYRQTLGDLKKRMVQLYPFHPHFLDIAFSIYGSASHYQNARGVIYMAAVLLMQAVDSDTDLVLLGQASPFVTPVAQDLRQLNIQLVERCEEDLRSRQPGISYAEDIMASILFHSFAPEGKSGATLQDIVLGSLTPTRNVNELVEISVKKAVNAAWFVDETDGRYCIVPEPVLRKLIEWKARELLQSKDGKAKVATRVRRTLGEFLQGEVYIRGDELPDNDHTPKYVLCLEQLTDEEVVSLTAGKIWRNTFVVLGPRKGPVQTILEDQDLFMTAARLIVSEDIREEGTARAQEVRKYAADFDKELKDKVAGAYATWYRVGRIKRAGEIAFSVRRPEVDLSPAKLDELLTLHYDVSALKVGIRDLLQESEKNGKAIRESREDFKKLLGMPMLIDRSRWETALRSLVDEDKEVVVRAGKILYPYHGVLPSVIQEDWRAWLQLYAPPPPPPIELKELVEQMLKLSEGKGIEVSVLISQAKKESEEPTTDEEIRSALVDLIADAKAVVEDQAGEIRYPDDGTPSALEGALIAWHADYAPPDDRQARRRVSAILGEKEKVGLGLLYSVLSAETIPDAILRGLDRLLAKGDIWLQDSQGTRLEAIPSELTDKYLVRVPEGQPPPPPPPPWKQMTIESGVCGSAESLVGILRDRVLDDAQVLSLELKAEPKDTKHDILFGLPEEAGTYAVEHTLLTTYEIPTTKQALLVALQTMLAKASDMKLSATVTVRILEHGYQE